MGQIVTLVVAKTDEVISIPFQFMFKKLRDMYKEYKPYVRVDLVMYAVLILLIILYFIYSVVFK